MGRLLGREIVQTRTWIDPENPEPNIRDLDYKFTYPVTVFAAVFTDSGDNPQTLTQVVDILKDQISSKQPMISGGRAGDLMTWQSTPGAVGSTEVVTFISPDENQRTDRRIPTERAIGAYIDTRTPLILFNSHISDVDPDSTRKHVSDEERRYWNSMVTRTVFDEHANNKTLHVTPEERRNWDSKADGNAFNEHVSNTSNPHKVTAEQVGTYTRQQIRELITSVQPKFFNYKNIYWNTLQNPPTFGIELFRSDNWDPNYVFDYRYNQDYWVNPNGIMPDGTPFTVDRDLLRYLPDLLPGKRYFALVAKLPPNVDGRSGPVQLYFKDLAMPWEKVAEVNLDNGDMFITYPDRTMYLWVGGQFIRVVTSSALTDD